MADQSDVVALNPAAEDSAPPVRVHPLANRNFRLLWLGENVSLFGDQFYFVALPWLVFEMTQSSLAFGTVLMVAGIPRAVFTLVGGVITDRISPRMVMITSNLLRLVITVILILIVAGQVVQLWMLYVIAFCFGLVDAFFHPAYRSIVPLIVEADQLQASNSLMMGGSQLVQIAGPGIAGNVVRSVGILPTFVLDALTFVFTSIMLFLMSPITPQKKSAPDTTQKRINILTEIGEMLAFVRRDTPLSLLVLVVAAVNLLFTGPLIVGAATLARIRFVAEGPAAFGAILSMFSLGALAGTLGAGLVRSNKSGRINELLLMIQGGFMVCVAFAPTLIMTCGLFLLMGIGAGFAGTNMITLTQKRVAKEMMGRFMSLIVLAEVGLTPISNAVSGAVADLNVMVLYIIAGGLLTLTMVLASKGLRSLD